MKTYFIFLNLKLNLSFNEMKDYFNSFYVKHFELTLFMKCAI